MRLRIQKEVSYKRVRSGDISERSLTMRTFFAGCAAAAFLVALSAPAFAKTETVKGQIVDESCYKMDKTNTGKDHTMPHIAHTVEITGDVMDHGGGKMMIASDSLKMVSK